MTLRAEQVALTIGLGHPSASVALFLDADGQPWHARGAPLSDAPAFRDEQTGRSFETYLPLEDGRRISSVFIASPANRPESADWRREGRNPS